MDEAQRRDRLIQWLEVIFRDLQDLLIKDHIFWKLQDIVRGNPKFKHASGLFTRWMASVFIQSAAAAVRRQAKTNHDTVSLKRFLLEVQKYPGLVSREHYTRFFDGKKAWHIESAQRQFDGVADEGGTHISAALVEQQLRELGDAVQGIEHYVDRRIAHYDKRGLARPTPTLGDLSRALNVIEDLVTRYWVLLKGEAISVRPTIVYDWMDIFRFPWIGEVASNNAASPDGGDAAPR
jgi:hypothetical protein